MTESELEIKEIRKINNWDCPYQMVKFVGYDRDGNKIYLLSQMGGGRYEQKTITYYK